MKTGTLIIDLKNIDANCKFYIFKNSCPNRFDKIQELNWYYKIDFYNNQITVNYKSELQYEISGYTESLPIETGIYYIYNSKDSFKNPEKIYVSNGFSTKYTPEIAEANKTGNAYYDALTDLIY